MIDRTTLPPVEDDFMRALLRSADSDEPSHAAYAKVASALGASVGVGVGVGVGSSASLPPAVAAAGAGLSTLARWSSSVAARLAAFGAAGALVLGGVLLLRSRSAESPAKHAGSPAKHAVVAAAPSQEPRRAVPEPPRLAPVLTATASAVPVPARPASAVARQPKLGAAPRAASGVPARSPSGSSLAEQVQSLDRARVALNTGDSSGALREIAHYRSAWPSGVFVTEASVLEIEALAARGERSQAAMRASAFVAAHPDSPQASRLRALIPPDRR